MSWILDIWSKDRNIWRRLVRRRKTDFVACVVEELWINLQDTFQIFFQISLVTISDKNFSWFDVSDVF